MKALVAALALLAVAPAAAIEVTILRPAFGDPAFGEVAVEVEVRSALEVVSVELFADGRSAGRLEKPPFRWTVQVGDDNVVHRFEVVAEDSAGKTVFGSISLTLTNQPPIVGIIPAGGHLLEWSEIRLAS